MASLADGTTQTAAPAASDVLVASYACDGAGGAYTNEWIHFRAADGAYLLHNRWHDGYETVDTHDVLCSDGGVGGTPDAAPVPTTASFLQWRGLDPAVAWEHMMRFAAVNRHFQERATYSD